MDYSATKYDYDLNGNLTTKTDRNNNSMISTYDGLNRLTFKEITDGIKTNTTSINYNKIGLVKEKNVNGYLESFEYTDQGYLKEHSHPDYWNDYLYDTSGNIKRILTMKGLDHIQTATHTYDALDRMLTVSDQSELQGRYTYDANGNRESLKYLNESFGSNYSYNLMNQVTSINHFNSGAPSAVENPLDNVLPDYAYSYQLNGAMTSETDTTTLIEKTFDYDDMNRLKVETKAMNGHIVKGEETTTTSEEAPDLLTDYNRSYTYDDYGNILSKVDADQTIEYTYDKNNRLIKEKTIKTNETIIKSFSYDPNGNMLSEKSQILTNEAETPGSSLSIKDEHFKIYEYNLLNQQVLVATKNGITKYTYNASGLRATKTTENKTVKFYYEGSKIIGEETNGTLTATYLYGQGLINRKDQATNEKHYYFFNVHGDVTALTDETGEVVTVYDYNAYGEFNQRGKDIDNPFTYFGQYYDKETGHYYLRARYYNPSTMRFTQEDTYTGKSNDPLSLNRYLYSLGNPVMFVDPSGYRPANAFDKFSSYNGHKSYHVLEDTIKENFSEYENNRQKNFARYRYFSLYGLGSLEGEDYYIKAFRVKLEDGDFGGTADVKIVNGQINNLGGENANLDVSGSFCRLKGGFIVLVEEERLSGEISTSADAAIVEGQEDVDIRGKNYQATLGFAPSGGSLGGHFKLGRNYYDELGVYHKFNLELGGALGVGGIAKIDITDKGHGQEIYYNYPRSY